MIRANGQALTVIYGEIRVQIGGIGGIGGVEAGCLGWGNRVGDEPHVRDGGLPSWGNICDKRKLK